MILWLIGLIVVLMWVVPVFIKGALAISMPIALVITIVVAAILWRGQGLP